MKRYFTYRSYISASPVYCIPRNKSQGIFVPVVGEEYMAKSCPNEISMMAEKQKKSKKKLQATSSLENYSIMPENQQGDKILPLRLQSIDLPDVRTEEASYLGRRRSSSASIIKSNATFHKQFKDLPETENVIDSFKCALHKEVPYHGKMYVTGNFICFYSNILKETKLVVPVTDVVVLKKQNIALLVPNALCIKTSEGEKHLFASLRSRDFTFKVLKTVCSQLENTSSPNSPQISTPENGYDAESKILQELNQSSFEEKSEELDTVDCIPDSPQSTSSTDSADVSRNKALHNEKKGRPIEETLYSNGNSWFTKVTKKVKSFAVFHESMTFNTLIIIYVLLVLLLLISSGYIGLRIVALEEQLMSMGAWPEFHTQSEYKST